jgi:hypothetical protein
VPNVAREVLLRTYLFQMRSGGAVLRVGSGKRPEGSSMTDLYDLRFLFSATDDEMGCVGVRACARLCGSRSGYACDDETGGRSRLTGRSCRIWGSGEGCTYVCMCAEGWRCGRCVLVQSSCRVEGLRYSVRCMNAVSMTEVLSDRGFSKKRDICRVRKRIIAS